MRSLIPASLDIVSRHSPYRPRPVLVVTAYEQHLDIVCPIRLPADLLPCFEPMHSSAPHAAAHTSAAQGHAATPAARTASFGRRVAQPVRRLPGPGVVRVLRSLSGGLSLLPWNGSGVV